MGKFIVGNGQYIVYAREKDEARQVISKELQRVDDIKVKMANLLSTDGKALQNFLENTSEENLNIHFNDETSLIYDNPENATTKGEVRQRNLENGKFTYDLAYRYPNIQGHNADFRLAHEMGHLVLNPSNVNRQIYDRNTDSRQVSGFIRRTEQGQFYGTEIQENAINLIAQLAIRREYSADDIITGKADVSESNLYKRSDDLVKLLAVSMRNDFDTEMTFEQLMEHKIDSMIEHSDGTKEPANTFFYGVLNDSSIIENEFDKYMGKGTWRDLDIFIANLHDPNISPDKFELIFNEAQGMIMDFANARMQDKYKEAVERNGNNIPTLESKINMINSMVGIEKVEPQQTVSKDNEIKHSEEYSINEFGEIIRPEIPKIQQENVQANNNQLSLKQRIAQLMQKSNVLMNFPFVENFVNKQLNVLPPSSQQRTTTVNSSRESFVNWISNNGEYRNLPPIQRMSDPERLAQMQRRMQQNQQINENDGR